ncbi:MAG: glucose-6-phosphate isomerase, partial [Bacteroidota bacterium]
MLKNINPTTTKSWEKLESHFSEIKSIHLNDLFKHEKNRERVFSLTLEELQFNFSKNRISNKTLKILVELAHEIGLEEAINSLFCGEKINTTENRAVLHTALREFKDNYQKVDKIAVFPQVEKARNQVKSFTENIISGKWKGYTDKPITDIVNIGIGGSDLGPQMVVEALEFYSNNLKVHFISNVDGDAVHQTLKKLNPETTLFVVVSKT